MAHPAKLNGVVKSARDTLQPKLINYPSTNVQELTKDNVEHMIDVIYEWQGDHWADLLTRLTGNQKNCPKWFKMELLTLIAHRIAREHGGI